MHLADGVLQTPAVVATSVAAGALVANGLRKVENEDIPKISLMTATFFVFALMSFKAGPSSVHPLLGGLIGIILGWKAPIAIFIGLVLQAAIFQHGGFTTLGINTLMVSIPSIIAYLFFRTAARNKKNITLASAGAAVISVALTVAILLSVLALSGANFKEIILIIIAGHIPLAIAEGFLTAAVVKFLSKTRPEFLSEYNLN